MTDDPQKTKSSPESICAITGVDAVIIASVVISPLGISSYIK